jgi:hypothetical protein
VTSDALDEETDLRGELVIVPVPKDIPLGLGIPDNRWAVWGELL